jgi:hypothetical protein
MRQTERFFLRNAFLKNNIVNVQNQEVFCQVREDLTAAIRHLLHEFHRKGPIDPLFGKKNYWYAFRLNPKYIFTDFYSIYRPG